VALLVAAANAWIAPNDRPVYGSIPIQKAQSLLDTRLDLAGISSEFAGERFLSLLLQDINQKFGQVPTERQGLAELITFAATMPFRAVPQDTSYAFLRGINKSDIFWQRASAAKGTGIFLEANDATNACTDANLKGSATSTSDTGAMWGFKEHPLMYEYFYIYNRATSARKICNAKWLSAKTEESECNKNSAL
jgi:hypothetical protein